MVDYTRDIGGNTTLMIRDTGGNVEFWVRTGPTTWNNEQSWSYGANGGNSPILHYRMVAGGNWQHFGTVFVGYDQDVRFTIYNSSLGFPTYDFWQHISRSTVPAPPSIWQADTLSSTHIRVSISDGNNGGSAIVERQLGYGGNPNGVEYLWDITAGTTDIGAFAPGSRIFFWARTRNAIGWSGWSGRAEATTWRVPDSPNPVSFTDVDQKSVQTHFNDRFDGGQPILERQLGYGKDPDTATTTVTASPSDLISNLDPGKLYYFWSRSRNSIGWSPWSERSQVLLVAGARIYQGGEWKRAVPYIKVDGTWKVVRPWIRSAGEWKETSL